MASPPENTISYPEVQAQEPMFYIRQVLVKTSPGSYVVPSGIVTSVTNIPRLHGIGVFVGVGVSASGVFVSVGAAGSPELGSGVTDTFGSSVWIDIAGPAATVSATDLSMIAVCSAGEGDPFGMLQALRTVTNRMTVSM